MSMHSVSSLLGTVQLGRLHKDQHAQFLLQITLQRIDSALGSVWRMSFLGCNAEPHYDVM